VTQRPGKWNYVKNENPRKKNTAADNKNWTPGGGRPWTRCGKCFKKPENLTKEWSDRETTQHAQPSSGSKDPALLRTDERNYIRGIPD